MAPRMAPPTLTLIEVLLTGLCACLLAGGLASAGWTAEAVALGAVYVAGASCSLRTSAVAILETPFRRGATDGIALGCCTPPLTVGALALVRLLATSSVSLLRIHLWAALACGMQAPLTLWLDHAPVPSRLGTRALSMAIGMTPAWLALGAIPAGAVCGALLVHACCVHGALRRAPRSFTAGEAATLSGGAALLALDALLMTACEARCSGDNLAATAAAAGLCPGRAPISVATAALTAVLDQSCGTVLTSPGPHV